MDDFEIAKLRNATLARGRVYLQMAADARSAQDARQYKDLCDRYGLPHDDEALYQRGCAEMQDRKKVAKRGVEELVADGPNSNADVDRLSNYWAPIARIILANFGGKQEGEHIGVREYRERLSRIKKLGYPVSSDCNTMPLKQIKDYFKAVRDDVRKNSKNYCMSVVREVSAQNFERRTEYCP